MGRESDTHTPLEGSLTPLRPIWRRRRQIILTTACVAVAALTAGLLASTGAFSSGARQAPPTPALSLPDVPAPTKALTPRQVRAAYQLGLLAARGILGSGQTIVIVDSFGSPTIAADLAFFDSYFGLPPPP